MQTKDFNSMMKEMQERGMVVPDERVFIQIPNVKAILTDYFTQCLETREGKSLIWHPEYDEVAEWLTDNQGKGLLLFGDCGLGKSLLSRYILPAIILSQARRVVSTYDVQEMNKRLDEVLTKKIISIDDVGTEGVSNDYGNKRVAFDEVMDAVEKKGKLIIITTNLDGDALSARYGKRVLDRIIATTRRIKFTGKSDRK